MQRDLGGERDNLKTQLTEAKKRESALNTKLMEAQKLMETTKVCSEMHTL